MKSRFMVGALALVGLTALPLVARTARHDAGSDASQTRPVVSDDTASLRRMLSAVRGSDPLLCELAVRSVDMHGWWSHWGPISGDPLEWDSTSAAIVRWIQDDHNDPRLVPTLTAAWSSARPRPIAATERVPALASSSAAISADRADA